MTTRPPLHHIVRIRTADDLSFANPAWMDELMVNANLLEHCPESTASALRTTSLPYCIDPMLTRFQIPEWWRNEKGETKRNYARLAAAYAQGTSVQMAAAPLMEAVPSDQEWRSIAANVIAYQQERLTQIHPQLELFRGELHPVRLLAPALVAFTRREDRVNRLLAKSASESAGVPIGLPIIVPPGRLGDSSELDQLLNAVPADGISSYFLWTPGVTEGQLLDDPVLLGAFLKLLLSLANRGLPVGHLHGGYLASALHDVGISAVVHHLGWVDRGTPAHQIGGGPRSCQTYVPGIRRTVRFDRAEDLGRGLDGPAYVERYCWCSLCTGAFEAGQHPLDLLLESQAVRAQSGRERLTPTGRATTLNTFHYLHARRQEVEAFSRRSAAEVIQEDVVRASALAGQPESGRLRRLASGLRSA